MNTNNLIANAINNNKEELLKELNGDIMDLSYEEQMLVDGNVVKVINNMTLEDFAKKYSGNTLSVLYKDGEQSGFIRLGGEHDREVLRSPQNIVFDVPNPPQEGIVNFNLNDFR